MDEIEDSPKKRIACRSMEMSLTDDCLRLILRLLGPRDVCTCALVCKRLSVLAVEDGETWRRICEENLDGLGIAVTSHEPAATLRDQLHLQTYRQLYQVLHRMRGWPVGFWQRVDAGCIPHGEFVQVRAHDGQLVARALIPTGSPMEVIFSAQAWPAPKPSNLVSIAARSYADAEAVLQLQAEGSQMTLTTGRTPPSYIPDLGLLVHRIMGTAEAEGAAALAEAGLPVPEWWGNGAGASDAAQPLGLGPLAWDHTRQRWIRMHHPLDTQEQVLRFRRLPQPTPLPVGGLLQPLPQLPNGGFPALDALRRLEGYWSACYGPHGLEILHIRVFEGNEPGPRHCPSGNGPRLVALKVTGDPNVPTGKVTLFTLDAAPILGRYSGFEPEAGPDQVHRPIVAFQEDGMTFVEVGQREVLARFRAKGQMNYVPGVWDPVWSLGQVLLYEDDTPCFSMLFDDEGEHFRHIIDYTPLPLPPP